jgi:para-aminobenzoate synthetase component 1
MDSCNYQLPHHSFECLVAADAIACIDGGTKELQDLDHFFLDQQWKFGHLSYDLKNRLYPLANKQDQIAFPDFFFFIPKHLVYIKDDQLFIESDNTEAVYHSIMNSSDQVKEQDINFSIQQRLSRDQYIHKIEGLKQHILRGDCYEVNFCQEFYAEDVDVNPTQLFHQLVQVSPNPFSVFYRFNDKYLLCASPERFIKKGKQTIISQPIKGTAKRDLVDNANDEHLIDQLRRSKKEQAENVMIVDLVRNDLSKICERNSVKVDELFGIYSFPQVHQMISTISGQLEKDISFSQILEALFPMGSMTGAPKHRVLQLIDEYEETNRGIFSGSVGYLSPENDFDFNVVIRSIMYNSTNKYLSYQVGSGITFYSDAEKEWEECLLKAEAIKKVLKSSAVSIN